jgi:hypothetical protein
MNRYEIALKKSPALCVNTSKDALSKKVWFKLCEYLGFDVDELFNDVLSSSIDAVIFGGAVRDSLAEMEIHDVDILALPIAARIIRNKLQNYGYNLKKHGAKIDVEAMYTGIKIINEPWTFFRDDKIVQVIRPAFNPGRYPDIDLKGAFNNLLANVDISACGVIYNEKVSEVIQFAIENCCNKKFSVNPSASMHQKDRIGQRIAKLKSRGWKQVEPQATFDETQYVKPPSKFERSLLLNNPF